MLYMDIREEENAETKHCSHTLASWSESSVTWSDENWRANTLTISEAGRLEERVTR